MNYANELKIAAANLVETAINSPRLAGSIGGTTGSLGVAMLFDWVQGFMAFLAVAVGIVMTLVLTRVHLATVRNRDIEYKILLRQYQMAGTEPSTEKSA